ncbi:hypothetical protein BH24GEM3_BH24GEM3_15100 [soil metagenome]
MPRWAKIVLGVVAVLLLLVLAGVMVITQTNWGREQVRQIALRQIEGAAEGEVRIGRVEGNLLTGIRLADVSIVDTEGRPFIEADTIATRYSLMSFVRQRIVLSDLRMVRPVIVLDKPPGEEWNFARIFPTDTTVERDTLRRGFGSWVLLRDVEIVEGQMTVRSEWTPPDTLGPAERDSAIAVALSEESRPNIQRVPGGFQNIMEFRDLSARFPEMRLADPDSTNILIEVESFRSVALPFRPPAAEVHDLAGRLIMSQDSLWFRDLQARLPGSRLAAEGVYALESAELMLRLRGEPVALADLRFLYPPLPEDGGGNLQLAVHQTNGKTAITAEDMELRIEDAGLAGRVGMVLGDTLQLHDTDLRFTNLDTRLIQRMAPEVELPRHGRLTGRVVLAGTPEAMQVDSDVTFADERAGTSRVFAVGEVGAGDEIRLRNLRLRFDPLQADLARDMVPDLPRGGVITGFATLDGYATGPLQLDSDLTWRDPRTGVSRVLATGGVSTGDEVRFSNLRVRFEPLRLDLLRGFAPQAPAGATLAGRATLNGSLAGLLHVDADASLRDPRTGVSRVAATGGIGMGEQIRFRDLQVRLDPFQVALARRVMPDFPLAGTLSGRAVLNGSPATRVAARADLVHQQGAERSHLVGRGEVATGPNGWAAVDLQLLPLSLTTVGRFAPAAGLRGAATGEIQARGELRDLALSGDLRFPDGGALTLRGTMDLASEEMGYDLATRLDVFNLATVTERAPAATSLTGVIDARGRGFDPATMQAQLRADIVGLQVDTLEADSLRVRVAVADGLARVDSTAIHTDFAQVVLDGSFGLVAARSGELRYRVEVDSLHGLAPYLPAADTAARPVEPRPAVVAAARERARADSVRFERATEVERMATGRAPAPPPRQDTLRGLPPDSLWGRVHAAGTLSGNVERFDLRGNAELEDVIFRGNAVGNGRAEYALLEFGTPQPAVELEAAFNSVLAAGFALDNVGARVNYRGDRYGSGRAVLAVRQDDQRDYRADAEFALSLERSELRLHETALRFDTVTWTSLHPGAVSWGGTGIQLDSIELASDQGGRIYLNGLLPTEGSADLDLEIENLQIAHVVALMQGDAEATGLVTLDARMEGTQQSPRFTGELGVVAASFQGRALPDTRASFAYADTELTTNAELLRRGQTLLAAEATLPVNLALAEYTGPRLLDRPLAVDVRADSLPLDALPSFTDAVSDVHGRLIGNIAIRGTAEDPDIRGLLNLDLGSFGVVPLGVRFQDIAGTVRMEGRTVAIDSLVAHSRGVVRITGELDMATLTEPGFDLQVTAHNALVMNNDQGRLQIDADLAVQGPFDGVHVTGDVHTRRTVLYIPQASGKNVVDLDDPTVFRGVDTVLVAERQEVAAGSPLMENLRVDVNLHISRETWVRSPDANVEIYTPEDVGPLTLHMDRAAGRLTLEGTVNTEFGEYEFMGRRFQLTRGTATFMGNPEINPLIQLAAEHEVQLPGREALEIRIVVGGTALEPTITLESSAQPPISQTDLMSYLAFGRGASTLLQQQGSGLSGQGGGGGGVVGAVAGMATQQLAAVAVNAVVKQFESDAARQLGLDVFNIAPADLPAEIVSGRTDFGNVLRGTGIEGGRYVTPRLFVAGHARPTFVLPGARLVYRTPNGFRWITSLEPRFLPREPTLADQGAPAATSVFGAFLLREWRF